MCNGGKGAWRCDVTNGVAVLQEWLGEWRTVALIPLEDAVDIARTLMAHRKRALAPEADAMEAG